MSDIVKRPKQAMVIFQCQGFIQKEERKKKEGKREKEVVGEGSMFFFALQCK